MVIEVAQRFSPLPRSFAAAPPPRDNRMAALGIVLALGFSLAFWTGLAVMLARVF